MNSKEILEKYDASFGRIIEKSLFDHEDKLKDFNENIEQWEVFEKHMTELFDTSDTEMFYWDFCPFSVYEHHYNNRKNTFLKKIKGSTEKDFVNFELRSIEERFFVTNGLGEVSHQTTITKDDTLHLVIDEEHSPYHLDILNHLLAVRVFIAQKRKVEFLIKKKEQHENSHDQIDAKEDMLLDLSNSTEAMKIVYLQELGILNYLQTRMNEDMIFNANRLAEVISSFTGIDSRTAQSYLNPIYSRGISSDKNPLKPKNVEKVRQKLSDLGFSMKKTF